MTITVKTNTDLVVPERVRQEAGIKPGDQVEFKVSGGVINIIPKRPSAKDDYTPEQRRAIDAQLAEGLADIKAGRIHGPFNSADEMVAHMKARLKKRAPAKRTQRS